MRLAFSILHNAEHHLKHNDQASRIASMVDYWAVAVGACRNGGSTSWCREMPDRWHDKGLPIDGTIDELLEIDYLYGNIRIVIKKDNLYSGHPFMWDSKDQQANAALDVFKNDRIRIHNSPIINNPNEIPEIILCERMRNHLFLWQFDADEQWEPEQLQKAEESLICMGSDTGMFHADFWVGKSLKAMGEWGEGQKLPYRRLWKWDGQYFKMHEPPVLDRGNGKEILLPQRFQHYAYCFDQDIRFKDEWYRGHEGVYERWKNLNKEAEKTKIGYKWPIDKLIIGPWGKTNTVIKKVKC